MLAHINVKPLYRDSVYETAEQAIKHLFIHGVGVRDWDFGGRKWGQTIEDQRKIMRAMDSKDLAAFVAYRRRGYWRVEVAEKDA